MIVSSKRIGILAMQGAIAEHREHLEHLSAVKVSLVKSLEDLNGIDGLILPGGESTAMGKLLDYFNLTVPLREKILEGLPVWGTCAGMILLARKIENEQHTHLATMDITVRRNAYGSQLDSFITEKLISKINPQKSLPLVFIRAPYITKVNNDAVEILAKVDEHIVAAKENNMLVTSFHPELTDDLSVHKYFLTMT